MPRRRVILANGEIYHIFNRSIAGIPIFKGVRETDIFLEAMRFYLQLKPPTKFSIYRKSKARYPISLEEKIVTIINYCLMPNHFHLILRQEKDDGVKNFMQRVSNSFAHYFSIKYKKRGHVFEDKYKAVHVETEEQLLHLSRYIHLNPVTAYLTEKPENYPFSAYLLYLGQNNTDFVDPSIVLSSFSSRKKYKDFVLAQIDYQRTLKEIEHLILE